jgi:dihydroneopterin aldolase
MTDKVFINGLRAETVIGVYDWERSIRQPLIFDLEMATDNRAAAKDDDLTKAIDYAAISQRVIAEVEASSFQLIETLAEHLAALILEEFGVQWLQLRVLKPSAVAEADAVGVQIQRGDASFSKACATWLNPRRAKAQSSKIRRLKARNTHLALRYGF